MNCAYAFDAGMCLFCEQNIPLILTGPINLKDRVCGLCWVKTIQQYLQVKAEDMGLRASPSKALSQREYAS